MCVCFCVGMSYPANMGTHKPDQTTININGFFTAKSAKQLMYGSVLVLNKDLHDQICGN